MLIAASSAFLSFSAESNSTPLGNNSERTAVVTNEGVRGIMSGGSSQNPAINDLITVQDMAGMQGVLNLNLEERLQPTPLTAF